MLATPETRDASVTAGPSMRGEIQLKRGHRLLPPAGDRISPPLALSRSRSSRSTLRTREAFNPKRASSRGGDRERKNPSVIRGRVIRGNPGARLNNCFRLHPITSQHYSAVQIALAQHCQICCGPASGPLPSLGPRPPSGPGAASVGCPQTSGPDGMASLCFCQRLHREQLYNGPNAEAPLIGSYCGNTPPPPNTTTGSSLHMSTGLQAEAQGGKVKMSHCVSVFLFVTGLLPFCCGGDLSGPSGSFNSPGYPNRYPENRECIWYIQTASGSSIQITIHEFDVEYHADCTYDLLEFQLSSHFTIPLPLPPSVTALSRPQTLRESPTQRPYTRNAQAPAPKPPSRNVSLLLGCGAQPHPRALSQAGAFSSTVYGGPDLSAPRLAQLCTTRPPSSPLQVSSTGNAVTVRFKSDAYISGRGFNASWLEVPGGCGGAFTAPSGEIHSPGYPNNYPNNVDCSWVITVDAGHRVLFNFSLLEIESHSSCQWDYVAIHDGPSQASPLLAQVCGFNRPDPIISTQNTIYLRFRSDVSANHKGFSARFSEACGATIISDDVGGAIASPRYPYTYPANQNCSWIIKAQEPFNHVTLSFTDFVLENNNGDCSTDYVEILDGDNYNAPSVGTYCGSEVPHPVTSYGDALVVNFISNSAYSEKGFRATYAASTSGIAPDDRACLSLLSSLCVNV
ncbi:hypothetical protein JZ751_017274 [Albula glossodonta]|uniref:CUB domain-containing protein n=1 Tax=Albula glossodonta TaxID=121402 RepID=A0A8T2N041_9TELE|nr:hypothetical protein JZ751_017274 [Albula glossodonta]